MPETLTATLIWIAFAIVLFITEAVTVQLVAIWLAVGALVTAVAAYLGVTLWTQFFIFAAVSAIALLLSRPFAKTFLKTEHVKTNLDRVVGEIGVVIEDISGSVVPGRVNALGLDWSAVSADGKPIEKDSTVRVLKLDGVKLVVEKFKDKADKNKEGVQ